MLLKDKVVCITGGTSGIGEATVYKALEQGARVCFIGRRKEEADKVIQNAISQ